MATRILVIDEEQMRNPLVNMLLGLMAAVVVLGVTAVVLVLSPFLAILVGVLLLVALAALAIAYFRLRRLLAHPQPGRPRPVWRRSKKVKVRVIKTDPPAADD